MTGQGSTCSATRPRSTRLAAGFAKGRDPGQACFDGCQRPIFAADPALVAEPIDQRQQERVVDFARARLMPARIVGDLDMGDLRHRRFETAGEVALHHLHMIEIGLQIEIVGLDAAHDAHGLVAAVQKEARHVAGVDRLDQEPDAALARRVGGKGEVGDECLFEGGSTGVGRRNAGEAIEARAAEFLGIIESPRDAVAELGFAPGEDSSSAFASLPVSGGQVEERLGQTVIGEPPGDIARGCS